MAPQRASCEASRRLCQACARAALSTSPVHCSLARASSAAIAASATPQPHTTELAASPTARSANASASHAALRTASTHEEEAEATLRGKSRMCCRATASISSSSCDCSSADAAFASAARTMLSSHDATSSSTSTARARAAEDRPNSSPKSAASMASFASASPRLNAPSACCCSAVSRSSCRATALKRAVRAAPLGNWSGPNWLLSRAAASRMEGWLTLIKRAHSRCGACSLSLARANPAKGFSRGADMCAVRAVAGVEPRCAQPKARAITPTLAASKQASARTHELTASPCHFFAQVPQVVRSHLVRVPCRICCRT